MKDQAKPIMENKPPRLIRWANDGFPPLNLQNELPAIIELIKAYQEINETRITQLPSKEQIEDGAHEIYGKLIDEFTLNVFQTGASFILNFGKDKKE